MNDLQYQNKDPHKNDSYRRVASPEPDKISTAQRTDSDKANGNPSIQQLKAFQAMADNSPRVQQFKAYQAMVDNSPCVQQFKAYQEMADNSSREEIKTESFEKLGEPTNSNGKHSVKDMKISDKGIRFIKEYEKFEPKPYNDAAGHATIGYGHLLHYGGLTKEDNETYKNGITEEEATILLKQDVDKHAIIVENAITVKLTQREYDALVIFAFNTGTLSGSTLAKRVNSGASADAIKNAYLMWNKVTDRKTGKKVVSNGLTNRRTDEAEIYNVADYKRNH